MYTPSKFWKNGGKYILYMLPGKEIKWCKVR
jgi:hypothetical protein